MAEPLPLTDIRCQLGEAPLWHDDLQRLFWFDILGRRLHHCAEDGSDAATIDLPTTASAGAIVDERTLLLAVQDGTALLDLDTGALQPFAAIEADDPDTRSNDCAMAPDGTFHLSTMGWHAQEGAGSLYRLAPDGCVERLRTGITIGNSLCFPAPGAALFTDSPRQKLERHAGGVVGPEGEGTVIVDLTDTGAPDGEGYVCDGTIADAEGCIWTGHWDGGCVVRRDLNGREMQRIELPTARPTRCALGGADLRTLYIATAIGDLADEPLQDDLAGRLFAVRVPVPGVAETRFRPAR